MAKDKNSPNELKSLVDSLKSSLKQENNVNMPAPSDKEKEMHYTELDLITGICSAALFGKPNQKFDNYKSIIGNPKYSFLYQISKNTEPLGSAIKVLTGKNLISNSGALNVEILNDNIIGRILLSLDDTDKLTDVTKSLTELSKYVINNDLMTSVIKIVEIYKLFNQIQGISDNKVKEIQNFSESLVDLLVNVSSANFDKLNEVIKNKNKFNDISTSITSIINVLNNISNSLDDKDINLNTTKLDSLLIALTDLFADFNNINIDVETIEKLSSKELFNSINEFIISTESIFNRFDSLNNQIKPDYTQNLVSNFNDIIDFISKYGNNKKFADNNFKANVASLNNLFSKTTNDTSSIATLISNISTICNSAQDVNKDIQGVGLIFDAIIKLISFDEEKKPNMSIISDIFYVTAVNGPIHSIIKNLSTIGQENIGKANENVKLVSLLFDTISDIGQLGLMKQIRVFTNLSLFGKLYVKGIKCILDHINESFAGYESIDDIEGLQNIQAIFNTLLTIGEFDPKDKSRVRKNIKFVENFIIDKYADIVKSINKNFSDDQTGLNTIISLQNALKSIVTFGDIDKTKLNNHKEILNKIQSLIFGNDLRSKVRKKMSLDTASILSISKLITENKNTFDDGAQNINNARIFVASLLLMSNEYVNGVDSIIKKINKINIDDLFNFINQLNKIGKDIENIIPSLEKMIVVFNSIDKKISGDIIKSIEEFATAMHVLSSITKDINLLALTYPLIKPFNTVLTLLSDSIPNFINKLNENINTDNLKNAAEIIKSISQLLLLTSISLLIGAATLMLVPFDNLITFALTLSAFTLIMGGISILLSKTFGNNKIETMQEIMYNLGIFMVICGGILLLGSYIMQFIEISALLSFAFVLGTFVSGIMYVFSELRSDFDFEKVIGDAKEIGLLIAMLGATLLFGSMLMRLIDLGSLALFAGTLFAFIWGLSKVLSWSHKLFEVNIEYGKEIGLLIALIGATLVFGSMFMRFIEIKDLFAFAGALGLFMILISLPLGFFGSICDDMMKSGSEFGKLVMMSGATLLIGALFMYIPGIEENIKKFAWTLGLFVFGISIAYGLAGLLIDNGALKIGKDLGILILISAGVLLLGASLMFIDGMKENILEFALTLGLFVAGISVVFALASILMDKDAIKAAWTIAILVGVSAIALTAGPILLKEYGIGYDEVFKFAVNMGLFLVIIAGVTWFISKILPPKVLWQGILSVAAVGALTYGLAWVISESYEMMSKIDWDKAWEGWKNAGILFGIVTGVVGILGAIMSAGGGLGALVMGAGMAAFAGIEALIYGLAKVTTQASMAVIDLVFLKEILDSKGIKDASILTKPIADFVGGMIRNLWDWEGGDWITLKKMAWIKTISSSIGDIAKIIGIISKSIKEYSELKIELFDKNGKSIGYRSLTSEDFINAAANITTIITCVGGSIMGLFGIGPYAKDISPEQKEVALEMLKVEPGGLFSSRKTKFGLVVEAISGLGKVISKISEGTIKYLKLPQDFDAQKISDNIAKIITTLGNAIYETYERAPKGMFDGDTWISSSPYTKVLKSTSKLGGLISNIAEGIQTYANLKYPIKWDENGKPIDFKPMDHTDFTKAGINIVLLLSLLGNTVMGFAQGDAFKKAYDMTIISAMIGNIGKVTKILADMSKLMINYGLGQFSTIKIVDGKMTTENYKIDDWSKIKENLRTSISNVILGMGEALLDVMNSKDSNQQNIINELRNPRTLMNFIENISKLSNSLITIFEASQKIIGLKILTGAIRAFIRAPFNEFTNIFAAKKDSGKYILLFDYDLIEDLPDALDEIGTSLLKLFQNINKIIELKITTGAIRAFIRAPFNEFTNIFAAKKDSGKYILLFDYDLIEDLPDALDEIGTSLLKLFQNINKIIELKITTGAIRAFIRAPFNEFTNIFAAKKDSGKYILLFDYDLIEDLPDALDEIGTSLLKLFQNINKIIELKITKDNITPISEVIDAIGNTVLTLKNLDYNESSSEKNKLFIDTLKDYYNFINELSEEYESRYNLFKDSLIFIYEAVSGIDKNTEFENHVKTLKDYVQTVNSINLENVQSLTGLVEAVNALGDKVGNIDKFTDTIANKLSSVLTHLTQELKKAQASIETADKLHKKRQTLINQSVTKIKELMEQEMTINLKKAEDDVSQINTTSPSGDASSSTDNATSSSPSISSEQNNVTAPQQTSTNNRGASQQKIKLEIDYTKLGEEIAKAIKKYK